MNGTRDPTDEDNGPNLVPFDPNSIRSRQITVAVHQVSEWLRSGRLELSPDFQRRATWSNVQQSRLIESLLVRIPLPAFFFAERRSGFMVIDGLQRLTALYEFIAKSGFRLVGLEFLPKLEGLNFDEIPAPLRRRLMDSQLVVQVLDSGTPPEAELAVFKRINTGGISLSAQEIRHAMVGPQARSLLERCTETREFVTIMPATLSRRMADRECVARYFAFRADGVERYENATDLDGFILDSMQRLDLLPRAELQVLQDRFVRAISASATCLGTNAFRRWSRLRHRGSRLGPINKALFECTTVAFDHLSNREIDQLMGSRERLMQRYATLFANPEFVQAISTSTGARQHVRARFLMMSELLERSAR